jgi:exonuclease VII small subunit
MKKVILTIISICLILACLFNLYSGVVGIKDALAIKEYKEADAKKGLDQIENQLLPGIAQLKENESTYLTGVDRYEAGLVAYANGQAALAQGQQDLAAGQAAYDEGKAQLETGKAAYEAGKKTIEENTEAYNEGKATLEKVMPIYNTFKPLYNNYLTIKAEYDAAVANGETAKARILKPQVDAGRIAYETELAGTGYSIATLISSVEEGQAQIKAYEDGLAQLAAAEKQISEGEAALAAGKKELDQGYADYAAGQARLADGAAQLADAKNRLAVFEDGAAQVAAGVSLLLLEQPAYYNNEGKGDKEICPSIREICVKDYGLPENFSIWAHDENGQIKVVNGRQYLDLNICKTVANAADDYIKIYQTETVTKELYSRIGTYIAGTVAAVAGLIAGLFGILCIFGLGRVKLGIAAVCGYICAALAVAANIFGAFTGYTGYTYPTMTEAADGTREYFFTGHTQVEALIIMAVVAVIFAVIVSIVRKAYKIRL